MVKKTTAKKQKKPRKPRAKTSAKTTKDKSVKQITNVNVTSSGSGGSGGASLPSPMTYQHPLMTASKVGEDTQIKKLTDLLSKTLSQNQTKPRENLVEQTKKQEEQIPIIEPVKNVPLFEDEQMETPFKIESKPINTNVSLLEQINTPKVQDEAFKVNEPDIEEQAQEANVEVFEEQPQEEKNVESKPEEGDDFLTLTDLLTLTPEQIKEYKKFSSKNYIKLNNITKNTFDYYLNKGKNQPLLVDKRAPEKGGIGKFKIIDNNIIQWDNGVVSDKVDRNRPLIRYVGATVGQHFFNNQDRLKNYSEDKKIKIKSEPDPYQIQLYQDALNKMNKKISKKQGINLKDIEV